jgi:hypothetical protein
MDTGNTNCLGIPGYGCTEPDQVQWFREQAREQRAKEKGFLFVHIPLSEYMNLYNDYEVIGNRGEMVSCPSANTGLFGAVLET